MTLQPQETDVCIVGGGPAGMVLGALLAQFKIRVLVLEQHRDFEREYRGEVLMPRFTQMMRQIRLFDFLEKYPHLKLKQIELFFKHWQAASVAFSEISPEIPFAIWMPQPVLLNALHDKVKNNPFFQIRFEASARGLIIEGGRVAGVQAVLKGSEKIEIRARLTVGADGRSSIVLRSGGFEIDREDYDFDLLWFTIPKPVDYDNTVRGFLSTRKSYLVLPKYPDLIQCGLIMKKGEFLKYRKEGIDSLRRDILAAHPVMRPFAEGLRDFSPFNVLQARAHHVKKWAREGCLLIGDAAHTCSPAGAIGVSVAVGTAIASADVIREAFKENDFSVSRLDRVQMLRDDEVKQIQKIQNDLTFFLFSNSGIMKWLTPLFLWAASKSGLLRFFQKRIAAPAPLPVREDLHF